MPTLTRCLGETLVIDADIRITVVNTRGNRIRLSLTVPTAVPIHREEIRLRPQQEHIAAVGR